MLTFDVLNGEEIIEGDDGNELFYKEKLIRKGKHLVSISANSDDKISHVLLNNKTIRGRLIITNFRNFRCAKKGVR